MLVCTEQLQRTLHAGKQVKWNARGSESVCAGGKCLNGERMLRNALLCLFILRTMLIRAALSA